MIALNLEKNVFSIQKCLFPLSDLVTLNFGEYIEISIPGVSYKYIAKVGLCEQKNLRNCCFADYSVLKFTIPLKDQELHKRIRPANIREADLRVLPVVQVAKTVEVSIIVNDVCDIKKIRTSKGLLDDTIRDILKLYVFPINSIIFLENLSKSQNLFFYGIIIHYVITKGEIDDDQLCRVCSSTGITVRNCLSYQKFVQEQQLFISRPLVGFEKVYEAIKGTVNLSRLSTDKIKGFKPNKNLLLVGPPGCGKSTLLNKASNDCDLILLKVQTQNINTSEPGETEKTIRKLFDRAKHHAENDEDCLIVIEDIDIVCINTSENSSSHSKRILKQLISSIQSVKDARGVVVIGTTNSPEDVDVHLRRPGCFDEELEIMIPTESDRRSILSHILSLYEMELPKYLGEKVAKWTPGFVAADLQLLANDAVTLFQKKKETLENCFMKAVALMTPSSLKGTIGLASSHETTFSEIGGLSNIKKILHFSVSQQLTNPQIFRRMGIPQTKGLLLYGPPGCAKTTLVKALAKENNTTFLAISAADLYSPFVGDAERCITKLFSRARSGAPSIIFIDEIDALVGSKSWDRERGIQERVLSTLLVEMDGVGVNVRTLNASMTVEERSTWDQINNGVFVIGATNRPDMLDEALLRPGRFDKLLYVSAPEENDRWQILKTITQNMTLHESVDLRLIAQTTKLYSGADLKNLCYESGLYALECEGMDATSIKQSHFDYILNKKIPSLNPNMIKQYEMYHCNFNKP